MFLRITFNMTCTITEDKIPSPILYIFFPPLGKDNRDESELSVRKKEFLSISSQQKFFLPKSQDPIHRVCHCTVMC